MKRSRIGFGVFLLTVGILILLAGFGILDWTIFYSIFRLWPLFIIVIGINIAFNRNVIVRSITWLTLLAVLITYSYVFHDSNFGKLVESSNVAIEKLAETKSGNLYLGFGGLELNVGSTNENLLDGTIAARNIKENYNYSLNKDSVDINFKKDEHSIDFCNFTDKQKCRFNLNKDVLWNVKVDIGAAGGNLNLADLQIGNLEINSGAVNFDIKLGNMSQLTNIKINTGASQFNISVPKDSGVRLKMEGALNSTGFYDINLIKDGNYYTTKNYDEAANKIDMDVSMAVGGIRITGY
jgi:hypothetical protein